MPLNKTFHRNAGHVFEVANTRARNNLKRWNCGSFLLLCGSHLWGCQRCVRNIDMLLDEGCLCVSLYVSLWDRRNSCSRQMWLTWETAQNGFINHKATFLWRSFKDALLLGRCVCWELWSNSTLIESHYHLPNCNILPLPVHPFSAFSSAPLLGFRCKRIPKVSACVLVKSMVEIRHTVLTPALFWRLVSGTSTQSTKVQHLPSSCAN